MFLSALLGQSMTILKNERISGGALVLMATALFSMYAWADNRHQALEDNSAARHAQNIEDMVSKEEFNVLQRTVDAGFENIGIDDASAVIRDAKLSLQMAKATDASDNEIARINDELSHAVDYKSCLVRRGSNCEHLRNVE